jgi:hypothetical protein
MVDDQPRLILPQLIGVFGDFVVNSLAQGAGEWRPVERRQFFAQFGALYNRDRFGFSSHVLSPSLSAIISPSAAYRKTVVEFLRAVAFSHNHGNGTLINAASGAD